MWFFEKNVSQDYNLLSMILTKHAKRVEIDIDPISLWFLKWMQHVLFCFVLLLAITNNFPSFLVFFTLLLFYIWELLLVSIYEFKKQNKFLYM